MAWSQEGDPQFHSIVPCLIFQTTVLDFKNKTLIWISVSYPLPCGKMSRDNSYCYAKTSYFFTPSEWVYCVKDKSSVRNLDIPVNRFKQSLREWAPFHFPASKTAISTQCFFKMWTCLLLSERGAWRKCYCQRLVSNLPRDFLVLTRISLYRTSMIQNNGCSLARVHTKVLRTKFTVLKRLSPNITLNYWYQYNKTWEELTEKWWI